MRVVLFFLIFIITINGFCFAESEINNSLTIEEIPAELKIKYLGSVDLLLLRQEERLYYPIEQLFNFLKIKIEIDEEKKIISGYYLDKKWLYKIDYSDKMTGIYNKKKYKLKQDYIIIKDNVVYFTEEVYREIFDIYLEFDFRKLSVEFKSRNQIPALTIYKAIKSREKILSLKEIPTEPYEVDYKYKIFNGSTLDWRINAFSSRGKLPRYRYALRSGSRIFGSDLHLTIKGTVYEPIKTKDINGFYRIPFWGSNLLGQITLGDLTNSSPNSIGRVRGIEITNRPVKQRIIQTTEEINLKADDSEVLEVYRAGGLDSYYSAPPDQPYKVSIELPYGISDYELRSYDKWGGVDRYLYRYDIPYRMLPIGEFQYSVKAGYMRNLKNAQYGNLLFEYGATKIITMGGELQYLNNDFETKYYPAAMATVRFTKGLTSEFSFSPFLRSVSKVNVVFPSDAFLTLSHEFFNKNSPINYSNISHQTRFNLRLPLKVSRSSNPYGFYYDMAGLYSGSENNDLYTIFSQLSGYTGGFQFTIGSSYYTNIYKQPSSLRTYYWSTACDVAMRLPVDVIFQISTNYNHNENKIKTISLNITKSLRNFFFTASYERVLQPQLTIANLNISYYLPFVRAISTINRVQGKMNYYNTLNGSIVVSGNLKNYYFEKRQMMGRGVLEFRPFYDSNNNGIREKEEEYIKNIKINQYSKLQRSSSRSSKEGLIIHNSMPYHNYTVVIPNQQFEKPNWVAKNRSVTTKAEPNTYKIIDLPIVSGGIVSGIVNLSEGNIKEPIAGITVIIVEMLSKKDVVGFKDKTYTSSAGTFDILNIPPGKYKVSLLNSDLDIIGCKSIVGEHIIEIISQPDGHIIDGIDFSLVKN